MQTYKPEYSSHEEKKNFFTHEISTYVQRVLKNTRYIFWFLNPIYALVDNLGFPRNSLFTHFHAQSLCKVQQTKAPHSKFVCMLIMSSYTVTMAQRPSALRAGIKTIVPCTSGHLKIVLKSCTYIKSGASAAITSTVCMAAILVLIRTYAMSRYPDKFQVHKCTAAWE
jgi:hypothetical protein